MINLNINDKQFQININNPIDISIPLEAGEGKLSAWYVPAVTIESVKAEGFIGSVKEGGSVNFRNITFNPHGHGTHTECVGHISEEEYSINKCLKKFIFLAQLISVTPETHKNGDEIITLEQIKKQTISEGCEAIIIRTLPNRLNKLSKNYSNTNPPFVEAEVMDYLHKLGINHFLIDTPSVDKEQDNGVLAAHHAFWQYPNNTQLQKTITELIYVPDNVKDDTYLLNLQIASFENDASPSKPILYKLLAL